MEVTFKGCEMDMSTILIIKCISFCIFNRMTFLVNQFFSRIYENVCNATQVPKKVHQSTKDAPKMRHGCTVDAQWKHQGCTLDAQWMLFEYSTDTPRIHSHVLQIARNASQVHHKCTLNTLWVHQECLMHALRIRLEYYLDVPRMPHGFPPMYHGRLTDTVLPCMYHGFSTHALLTLKLGHCPWTILFIYLFAYL